LSYIKAIGKELDLTDLFDVNVFGSSLSLENIRNSSFLGKNTSGVVKLPIIGPSPGFPISGLMWFSSHDNSLPAGTGLFDNHTFALGGLNPGVPETSPRSGAIGGNQVQVPVSSPDTVAFPKIILGRGIAGALPTTGGTRSLFYDPATGIVSDEPLPGGAVSSVFGLAGDVLINDLTENFSPSLDSWMVIENNAGGTSEKARLRSVPFQILGPYADLATALADIPAGERYRGMTFYVQVADTRGALTLTPYWWDNQVFNDANVKIKHKDRGANNYLFGEAMTIREDEKGVQHSNFLSGGDHSIITDTTGVIAFVSAFGQNFTAQTTGAGFIAFCTSIYGASTKIIASLNISDCMIGGAEVEISNVGRIMGNCIALGNRILIKDSVDAISIGSYSDLDFSDVSHIFGGNIEVASPNRLLHGGTGVGVNVVYGLKWLSSHDNNAVAATGLHADQSYAIGGLNGGVPVTSPRSGIAGGNAIIVPDNSPDTFVTAKLLLGRGVAGALPTSGGTRTLNYDPATGIVTDEPIPAGGSVALDDLTDVTILTPLNGHILQYNGAAWVNAAQAGGGDMLASVYDPTSIAGDTFLMINMVEGLDSNILTDAERTAIGNAQPLITSAIDEFVHNISGTIVGNPKIRYNEVGNNLFIGSGISETGTISNAVVLGLNLSMGGSASAISNVMLGATQTLQPNGQLIQGAVLMAGLNNSITTSATGQLRSSGVYNGEFNVINNVTGVSQGAQIIGGRENTMNLGGLSYVSFINLRQFTPASVQANTLYTAQLILGRGTAGALPTSGGTRTLNYDPATGIVTDEAIPAGGGDSRIANFNIDLNTSNVLDFSQAVQLFDTLTADREFDSITNLTYPSYVVTEGDFMLTAGATIKADSTIKIIGDEVIPGQPHIISFIPEATGWITITYITAPEIKEFIIALSNTTDDLTPATDIDDFTFDEPGVLVSVAGTVGLAPTGSAIITDLMLNTVTIMAVNKITIDQALKTSRQSATQPVLSTTVFAQGDTLRGDRLQVGSTIAGKRLKVKVRYYYT